MLNLVKRKVIWSLTGSTPAIGSGSHIWFAPPNTFITGGTSSSEVQAGAWIEIPLEGADVLIVAFANDQGTLTAGDGTVTNSELRMVALGMPWVDPIDTTGRWARPPATRANRANATMAVLAQEALAIATPDPSRFGLQHDPTVLSGGLSNNGLLQATTVLPTANDYAHWWVQIGKRALAGTQTQVSSGTHFGTTGMDLRVSGLHSVWIAAKIITTYGAGTTVTQNIDAQMVALLYKEVVGIANSKATQDTERA